jgi:hypothetical protein
MGAIHHAASVHEMEVLWCLLVESLTVAGAHHVLTYLTNNWWAIRDKWCVCYFPRLDAYITGTNNIIERYHKAIKEMFLKGKRNKRLDTVSGPPVYTASP